MIIKVNNIKIKRKLPLIVSSVAVVMGLVIAPQVLAEELIISGNGVESKSEVKVDTSSNTTVNQNNNSDVNNNVKVNENTGGNDANKNTGGDVSVKTGDASSNTSVTNSGNVSNVHINNCDNCGGGNGSVVISGNGAFSENKARVNASANNKVNVNQNARVRNNIDEDLVTGRNDANLNTGGDVSIDTGNIFSLNNILNKLNLSDISIAGSPFNDFLLKIFGNGAFSDNKVKTDFDNNNRVLVNNDLDLINNLKHRYLTGKNDANKNTGGDVDVTTGDITSRTNIENVANISKVKIECECVSPTPVAVAQVPAAVAVPSAPSAPTSAPTPSAAQVSPTSAPAPTSAPQQVMGAAAVLPITGNNWLILAILTNIVMLLMGAYLRLRSGRSPGMSI